MLGPKYCLCPLYLFTYVALLRSLHFTFEFHIGTKLFSDCWTCKLTLLGLNFAFRIFNAPFFKFHNVYNGKETAYVH